MKDIAICTIITKSYLAYARTLSESIKKYHPEIKIYVLLADVVDVNCFQPEAESFEWIYLSDLTDQAKIKQMSFYYTPFEFCCSLRGLLHEYIYTKTDIERWIFLDSDIMVVNSLEVIFEQLKTNDILLTPHARTPLQEEKYINPHEVSFLVCGCYNGGFLGLKRTENTYAFIKWLKKRLANFCFNDRHEANPRALYVDQLWLNLVPIYFDKVGLFEHSGANLGYWNLFENNLKIGANGEIMANKQRLLFVHFSGWDINNLSKVSIHSPMYEHKTYPLWQKLGEQYKYLLDKNGYAETINYPYAFAKFETGELISVSQRQCYYDQLQPRKNDYLSPFKSLQDFEANFKVTAQYKNKSELEKKLNQLTAELYLSQEEIKAMKTSKFWHLRIIWFKLKNLWR